MDERRALLFPVRDGESNHVAIVRQAPSISLNMAANVAGQAAVALATIVFVPTYIHYLGMEAYGLIGVFVTLQAMMTLFDGGMSPTLNREMARYTSGAVDLQGTADLIRSVEIIAIAVATAIAFTLVLLSGTISRELLNLATMSVSTAQFSFSIMAIVVALRFVESIYRSALLGLQLQVWFNAANVVLNATRYGGAAVVVAFISPTIEAFFLWNVAISAVAVLLLRTKLGNSFPLPDRKPIFSISSLDKIKNFALGMFGINALSVVLSQVDKVILVRLLSLAEFGAYSLAFTIGSVLLILSIAINQATLPVMVEKVSRNDASGLAADYHRTSQIVTAAVAPMAMLLLIFHNDVLMLWSGSATLAEKTGEIIAMVALGNLLNAMMVLPYFAMVAHGWTRLSMLTNLIAVVVIVPSLILLVPIYGTAGAAVTWIALNAGYVIVQAPLMHRRILKGELWRWYWQAILAPIAVALIVGAILMTLRSDLTIARPLLFMSLALTWLIITLFVSFTMPLTRRMLLGLVKGKRGH